MKLVSDKRRAQLKEYATERKSYLAAKPSCQVCHKRRAAEIHHTRGREGKLLLEKEFWLPVCWACHRKIHDNPRWARENGYR